MSNIDPEAEQTRFFKSINRPMLFMGGERALALYSILVCVMMVIVLLTWYSAIFGIVFFVVALTLLRWMAKADPLMSKVYIRYTRYKKYYYPTTREHK